VLVGDFSALTACERQRIELRCPRAQFIAIRSAVFGWSSTFHRQSECTHRRPPSTADQSLPFLYDFTLPLSFAVIDNVVS